MKKLFLFVLALAIVFLLSYSSSFAEKEAPVNKSTCNTTDAAGSLTGEPNTNILLASAGCGGNLNCGFNTGCAPGRHACCPRSAPNLNMCNCGCYAHKNYNINKGGCNVWHNCR